MDKLSKSDKEKLNIDIELEIIDFKEYKQKKEIEINTCKKIIEQYQEKIFSLEDSIQKEENRLKEKLLGKIPFSEFTITNTMFKYKTPSLELIRTKPKKEIQLKNIFNQKNIPEEFLETTTKIKWSEYKKSLIINGNTIVSKNSGEIASECEIITKPEEFKLKLK